MQNISNFIASDLVASCLRGNGDEPSKFGAFNFMEQEIWKDIEEVSGQYQVSNFGNVKRKKRSVRSTIGFDGFKDIEERKSNLQDNGRGYQQLYVQINMKRTMMYIHRLVAKYFIPNPFNLPQVNHKDGNKYNNHYSNLEWTTQLKNSLHASEMGLIINGERHHNSKLTDNKVAAMRRLYRMKPNIRKHNLAKRIGIDDETLRLILLGRTWKHVKNTR